MSKYIKIGHASISESGTVNGSPGDQSLKEVYINDNYDVTKKGYTVLLRPKNIELAIKSALACEAGCNNNNIGYSQGSRNTLYDLAKKNNFDLSTVGLCNTDCSAFVSTCAVAGGSSLKYYGTYNNGPVTSNMKERYRECGDYEILTDSKYFSSADYLRRGDILVKPSAHTIMILGFGSQISEYEIALFDGLLSAIKVKLMVTNISANSITAKAKIVKVENNIETEIDDEKLLKSYKWSYSLECFNNTAYSKSEKLKVTTDQTEFTLNSLIPNNSYMLKVYVKNSDGAITFSSAGAFVTTLHDYPKSVDNLKAKFNTHKQEVIDCTVTFNSPSSWGSATTKKGYTTYLIINGRIAASSDSLIKASSANVNKNIKLSDFGKNIVINYHDLIQVGVQPWIDTNASTHVTDNALMKCSKPFYFEPPLQLVDKTYLSRPDGFKRTIVYNRKEDF